MPNDQIDTPVKVASATGLNAIVALIVAGTGFMENLDGTVIAPVLPDMARDFAVHPVDLSIGISAYMLTLGVFIPISGWIADRFGAKRVFSAAIAIFTIASLLCGMAGSLTAFVALRILQGIGGAMMVPVGRLVVLRVTPKEKLFEAIAFLTWPTLIALALGPPLGGFIADHADWRWIFYLNVPLGIIAIALAWWKIPNVTGAPRPFDSVGFVLTGISLFTLLAAAELLGRANINWLYVGLCAVVGFGLGIVAVRHLLRCPYPLIGLRALRTQTFAVTVWGGSLFKLSLSAVPLLLPLMFQLAFGFSSFDAGMMMMAIFIGNLVMKPGTTYVLRRFGFRNVLIFNGLINAVSIGACALFAPGLPVMLMAAVLFIGGMSRSMQYTAYNTLAYVDVPQSEMNAANTLTSVANQLGTGLGVALGAICWRIGRSVSSGEEMSFRIAFALVAVVMVAAVWDSLTLPRNAGSHLARR